MNFAARGLAPKLEGEVEADVRRVVEIWSTARRRHEAGGPFLFGKFTIADAMFAPVCSRFTTYATQLGDYGDDGSAETYRHTVMALPAMVAWGKGCTS
jgi:glutathione S-transferase